MRNEEYRKYIKEMVDQIEDEESLKRIYNKVHRFFVCGGVQHEKNA